MTLKELKKLAPKNRKLTDNFWLHELIFGTAIPLAGLEMIIEDIDEMEDYDVLGVANMLERMRTEINAEFKCKNDCKEIGIVVTAGFRCLRWELHNGRSGGSYHRRNAADWVPSNVSYDLSVEIMEWVENKYWDRETGWRGGFAIKKPDKKKGTIGFIHQDLRSSVARWYY